MVVALPETEEQVRRILETCHALKVPVVPRGAGTGLSGGALPPGDGVLLSHGQVQAHRCASIRVARTAVVQPGVRNLAISRSGRAATACTTRPTRRARSPAPSAATSPRTRAACIASSTASRVHNVLRRARLHHRRRAGRVRRRGARRAGLRPARARHRLRRHAGRGHRGHGQAAAQAADARACIMASFDDVEKAGDAVADVIAAGIIPAGPRDDGPAGDARGRAVRARRLRPRRRGDPAVRVRRHARGSRRRDRAHERRCCARAGATRMRVSRDEAERLRFWSGRKNAFPGGRPHLARLLLHGRHHPAQAPGARCCSVIDEMEKKYGLRCANVFHAGDGNLHPLILFDANDADELRARRAVRRRDPRDCASRSAAPSPASTASASRRSTRCACSSGADELELFLAVKRAFDPAGLLNPGKAVPTLRAAPSSAGCTCTAASCRIPSCRAFDASQALSASAFARAASAQGAAAPARRRQQGLLRQRAARRGARHARLRRHRRATSRPSWSSPRAAARRSPSWRSLLERERPVPAVRAAAFRRRARRSAAGRGRAVGPAARERRRAARLRARREAGGRAGRGAALRRPGDEERRRLRRLAPARRLARHARPDRRGLAQGAAAAARRAHAALEMDAGARRSKP